METWDAITARRNVRSFTDRPIAPADPKRMNPGFHFARAR